MATTAPTAKIDVKALANEAGVAVEAYDTYDTDEETLAAAHRFAAALLQRVAMICEAQAGAKTLDAAALRKLAASLAPKD
jgi:hypothetical protein